MSQPISYPCISHCLENLLSLTPHPHSAPCLIGPGKLLIFQVSATLIKVTDDLCVAKSNGHFSIYLLCNILTTFHTIDHSHILETFLSASMIPYSPPPTSLTIPSQSLHSILYSFMRSFSKSLLRAYYLLSLMLGPRQSTEQNPAPWSVCSRESLLY